MKTDHWEDFMFRSGISQAKRIYLTMTGSLYPTCVQTVLAYKPKKMSKQYHTSSSNSSSRVSSSSSGYSDEEEPSAQTSTESSISDTIGSPDEDSDYEGIEPQAIPIQDHGSEDSKNGDNPMQNNINSDNDPSSSSDFSGGSSSDEVSGEYDNCKKFSSNKEDYADRLKKKERWFKYEPIYLDDSTFGQGKHVHVVSLPSYKMSIIPFVNP
jgi:hypothetical protein